MNAVDTNTIKRALDGDPDALQACADLLVGALLDGAPRRVDDFMGQWREINGTAPQRETTELPPRLAFAERIKWLRKNAGLTRDALQEKSGVSKGTFRVWENPSWEPGRGMPNVDTLILLAGALDMTVSELLRGVC